MALKTFIDDHGRRVRLGVELGRGGEAAVYIVEGHPALVAKVYHRPPGIERTKKLSRMVELQDEGLLSLAAWPVGTLFDTSKKSLVGFLMKNMKGFKDIHLLYNPKSRAREFPPKANWRFLVHTASNVARAFCAIHDHGHVIGDVNQSNVRVSPETAIVTLVDCDSFQISANEEFYPCEVGVPLYTPPELQETEFRDVVRTSNHDNFGLAILIFHLLFMGRHPFAGKFLGRGEMPIEKAIAEHRFVFAADMQRTQMLPPPACITLAHLPEEFGALFNRAFDANGEIGGRPEGRQWISALEALGSRLIVCSNNNAHLFFNGLSACPWCPIEASGVLLFVDYVGVDATSDFSLQTVWAQILAIPSPGIGNPPSLLSYIANVEPSPRAIAAARKRRYKIAVIVVALLSFLVYLVVSSDPFVYMYLFPLAIPVLRKFIDNSASSEFSQAARAAEAYRDKVEHWWKTEASGEEFLSKLDGLRALAEEYRHLPEQRKKKVRELEQAQYQTQLRHHLEKFSIATADFPNIKDGLKAMLSAYGIDDAGDITQQALQAVPGFGDYLISQLITWRQSLEATFRYDPGRGVDPADVQLVEHEIAKRRMEIEQQLFMAPAELKRIRRRILAARGRLQGQLEQALKDVAQAQADELGAA